MNIRHYGFAACAVALVLGGCAKTDHAADDTSPTPAAIVSPSAAPAESGISETPTATAVVPATSPAAPQTEAAVSATTTPAAFTDMTGVNGEQTVQQFARLGVVDPTSGAFHPGTPVKRRDFIRWLVKANNVLWADTPAKRVNLADATESPAFSDLAAGDPDFPYVQGMQDAGYSVGFPDKSFRPDQPLTREQMFAIKNVFDRGSVDPNLVKDVTFARNTVLPPWKDRAQISKTYVPAIATGANGGLDNFGLVYGTSSLFHPQFPVTRAQAALAVSSIADHVFYGSTHRTLDGVVAVASPTP